MIAPLRVPLAVLLLSAASVLPASAQSVEGRLLDDERDRPVPGARLYLLDEAGVPVDSAFTARDGTYRLRAPAAGVYIVHFQMDGWAGAGSEPLTLRAATVTTHDFPVVLVTNAAMRQMSDMIQVDERLQTALPEICGEALRPWEAGLLVGTVRARATGEPVPGARVSVATAEQGVTRSTVASAKGIYILCNVPLGPAIDIIAETADGTRETTQVEIRAGMVSWYDLGVGPRP